MARSCEGRIAIITGASRGIGQAIAVSLAAEGARVALVGRGEASRDKELTGTLDEGLERVRAVGGEAIAVHAQLDDPAFDRGQIVEQTRQAFGDDPDILIHSAAAPREFGARGLIPFAETPREWVFRGVEVNVWSFWDLAERMVPGMRGRGAGWLLGITSIQAAPRPRPPLPDPLKRLGASCIYGGTKAFLDRVVTGAATELYEDNIAVNNLGPTGAVATPLSTQIAGVPEGGTEPMETMVEAALALVTGDPRELTSRIAYSLPLLVELNRPVYTIDGTRLVEGWQPHEIKPELLRPGYLSGH